MIDGAEKDPSPLVLLKEPAWQGEKNDCCHAGFQGIANF
jgi:hypothetical protein